MSGDQIGTEFDGLIEAYYSAWFRYHPEAAVDAGVDGYADSLQPFDDDDIGALLALNEKLLNDLEQFDLADLSPERQIDCQVIYGAAYLETSELHEFDWRFHDPNRFLPINAIHQLMLRPVRGFQQVLKSRLAQIPEHLRTARSFLSRDPELVPVLWLETAVGSARAGVEYLRGLEQEPRVRQAFTSLDTLHPLLEEAARSLGEFAQFLEIEVGPYAAGDYACGAAHFDRLLHYRHFLDVDSDRLRGFGERLFEQTRRDLLDAMRELGVGEDMQAVLARLRLEHPSPKDLLGAYREAMRAAADFVRDHDLVSLPPQQDLKVVSTPEFLRNQIPFAAYVEPAPNDPAQCGYYYVTPPADDEELLEHYRLGIEHTCVHEAWPGHHLQFVTAHSRYASRSLPRQLNPSATLYEGWALYSEQLMQETGFLGRPESRFLLLRDRLWRALRILIDVGLHTGSLGLDSAAEEMVESLGFTYSQAMGDLTWYTMAPTVPMGYATGWALITAARERLRAEDPGFDQKAFHDRLLAAGSVALPLVLKQQFGEALYQSAHEMVF